MSSDFDFVKPLPFADFEKAVLEAGGRFGWPTEKTLTIPITKVDLRGCNVNTNGRDYVWCWLTEDDAFITGMTRWGANDSEWVVKLLQTKLSVDIPDNAL